MEDWRIVEELDRMKEWDADAICDALNLSAEELIDAFFGRAIRWIKENNE